MSRKVAPKKTATVQEEDKDISDVLKQGIFQEHPNSPYKQHRFEAGDDNTEAPPIPKRDQPIVVAATVAGEPVPRGRESEPRLAPAMEAKTTQQQKHIVAPSTTASPSPPGACPDVTTMSANDLESGEMVTPRPPPPPPLQHSPQLPGAFPIRGAGVHIFGRRRPAGQEDQTTVMTPVAAEVVQETPLAVAVPATQNWWSKRQNQLVVAGFLTLVIALTVVVTVLIMSDKDDGGGTPLQNATSLLTPTPEPTTPIPTIAGQWKQMGQDIDGEVAGDQSGHSVSLSADGTFLAIGAYGNDGNGNAAGHVRVYQWDGSTWVQLGNDIDGEAANDYSGDSVSLSADGTTVAIGAWNNTGNGGASGHVRIYQWDGGGWIQLGNDFDGEAAGDASGESVSLSANGTTVAIGADGNNGNGVDAGHVRVYQWDGSTWVKLGNDIDGEAAYDHFGDSVSLSADGTTVAIGAPGNDGNGDQTGHVHVYQLNGNDWVQVGSDLEGEAAGDYSGASVSLSAEGTTVAIGAPNWNSKTKAGYVRVYRLSGNDLIKVGSDLNGEAAGDQSGCSVSLSADGMTLAIGADGNDGNGDSAGHVRMYQLIENEWIQVGSNLDGEAAGDDFGISVSLSADGSTVAVGARYNDDSGADAGHVRVYHLEEQ